MENRQSKYHPMLFSTPMVQAILENRKNQTRRTKGLEEINKTPDNWSFVGFETNPLNEKDNELWAYFKLKDAGSWIYLKMLYNIGDVLWGRETFCKSELDVESKKLYPELSDYIYRAGSDYINLKWKPSIFMPKEACRIFLKIIDIRVERLFDISEEESINEGVEKAFNNREWKNYCVPQTYWTYAKLSFETLWISINGKASFNKNPWVWVIKFERIEKPK